MRKTIVLVAVSALALPLSSAHSQEPDRYRMEKTESGYVRMDTRTGAMSLCRERSDQLVCTVAADERSAYQEDIDRLHARIDALERRVAGLEEGGGDGADLPSDQEFEQTMGLMERFFRRFMGIVKDLERDFGGSEPQQEPAPDRT